MSDAAERAAYERILEFLRQSRGFDFTAYKSSSLMRRLLKRMEAVNVDDFETYLDYLQVHTDEFPALFTTILINVTRFFRDVEVWEAVAGGVLPSLLAGRAPGAPIRIWSAGAAAGQEAYTVAMLLAERLGPDAFRERVKIYATDVDDQALTEARQATYAAKQVADVPADLLDKYFERAGDRFTVKRELRRGVIFGHHDLLQDAPISRVDLLLCRNTLMYFNADAQARVMAKFYFSVGAGGFLVLGRAEMLFSHAALFESVDLKRRIFKAAQTGPLRERRQRLTQAGEREETVSQPDDAVARMRELVFDTSQEPQIVVDAAGLLVAVNTAARRLFAISPSDVGKPLQNLELSYRPAELRAHIARARDDRHEILVRSVLWERPGGKRYLDVAFAPLTAQDGTVLGVRVSFTDVTNLKVLQDDLAHSKQELETAYEELQSTNEELETTNEELQSTVEELETTNEELQSTNEELETMNEELQSTNEELQTMNDELRGRGLDLNVSNAFLESILASLRSAVVVLDRAQRIQVWNAGAVDLWGLRTEEALGEYFFELDIGLPVRTLHAPVGEVLSGRAKEESTVVPATSRKGRGLQCRVTVTPLFGSDRQIAGVIVLMDEDPVLA
jgi:two-component system, chemotaxis family, CheB/CheR fusion protein